MHDVQWDVFLRACMGLLLYTINNATLGSRAMFCVLSYALLPSLGTVEQIDDVHSGERCLGNDPVSSQYGEPNALTARKDSSNWNTSTV